MNDLDQLLNFLEEEGIIDDVKEVKRALLDGMGVGDSVSAGLEALESMLDPLNLQGRFAFEAVDAQGETLWTAETPNLVVNLGLDYALDAALSGAVQSASWYIGLVDGASAPSFVAGDTMGSHTGWTENQDYSETNRQDWVDGGVSGQSVDNTGSPAAFSISANTDIAGAFLVDENTKGGTTGTLFAEGSFSSTRSLQSGDTLNVEYTINAS